MAGSRQPGPVEAEDPGYIKPARTPGPLGLQDGADPDAFSFPGDTPGPVGSNDFAALLSHFSAPPPEDAGPAPEAAKSNRAAPRKPNFPKATSLAGIRLIEQFEGFSAKMYNDVANHCTIAYGQLLHKGPCTGKHPAEKPYLKGITRHHAEHLLRSKVRTFEKAIRAAVTANLNQNQFDALVSFVYNVGPTAFGDSTLIEKLNQGDYAAVPGEMRKWVNAGGVAQKGLIARRDKEAELFARPVR